MRRLGVLLAAVVTLVACGGGGGSGDGSPGTNAPAAAPVQLEGTTLDGRRVSLSDFRGTPVFVNVWASW
jgi:hypothetical protein